MASKMFFLSSPNSAPLIVPPSASARLSQSSEHTSANVVRFLSRVIDTVWNCMYKGNPIRILKCFLKAICILLLKNNLPYHHDIFCYYFFSFWPKRMHRTRPLPNCNAPMHTSLRCSVWSSICCPAPLTMSTHRCVFWTLSPKLSGLAAQISKTQKLIAIQPTEMRRNQQLFLTNKSNVDPLFFAALVHLVFMLSDRPQFDLQDRRNRDLERGTAQV